MREMALMGNDTLAAPHQAALRQRATHRGMACVRKKEQRRNSPVSAF